MKRKDINRFYWLLPTVGLLFLIALSTCRTEKIPAPDKLPVFTPEVLMDTVHLEKLSKEEIKILIKKSGLDQFLDFVHHPITIYKITYKTTFKNEEILASGSICLPVDLKQNVPLLSAQHGTIADHQSAPSNFSLENEKATLMEFFASGGYATFIPDYIGYGSSKEVLHPYYHYESQSQVVIDMIKAGKEFLQLKNIEFNDQLFLFGYSEGGYTTLATLKAIESDPNLNWIVTASSSGAGGYDISGVMEHTMEQGFYKYPSLLAFVIHAYNITYEWNRPMTDFFQEPYALKIENLFNGLQNTSEINKKLPKYLDQLFQIEFLLGLENGTEDEVLEAMNDNSVHFWIPKSPVRLYHSPYDETIPLDNTLYTHQVMKELGATNVSFHLIENGDHTGAVMPTVENTIKWFESFR
ncbi:lipase family protein [Xanthovirga aplysinae]|uniref:lipase family protein n=1 Tax=Xanthovirga aplysinae TaxID=2529853 RepID=UPI0012BC829E|nr:lipase family protein [Xanthovirga aplysinae]MTI33612.1 hypothetical protein [Xanthovirga aplysinae]